MRCAVPLWFLQAIWECTPERFARLLSECMYMDYFNYHRRKSSVVHIGDTPLGGTNPVRIQSMTNTSTMDTPGSVEQCIRIIDAGADYVRLTAQGVREAENLAEIKRELLARGFRTPLVADIHFNPKAADAAAVTVDKVRINPGNFVDSARTFKQLSYTDEEYAAELQRIRDRLVPFLDICREHGTAVRLGVNHGSLSDRIMSRYGDTPEGMVESCMEFLRICRDEAFHDVAISIKASNTAIMVKTVRMLVDAMEKEQMSYPLHLGVTEAGDGEDGRIKSAVGIGALLADGIGDTIRVSLSEDPELEIPVARKLVDYIVAREGHPAISGTVYPGFDFVHPCKRDTDAVDRVGGTHQPVVVAPGTGEYGRSLSPDYVYVGKDLSLPVAAASRRIVDAAAWNGEETLSPLFRADEWEAMTGAKAAVRFVEMSLPDLTDDRLKWLSETSGVVVVLYSVHRNPVGEMRAFLHRLVSAGCRVPVILKRVYREADAESLQIKAGADLGVLLLDGFGEGVWLENEAAEIPVESTVNYAFALLQAARRRISKTEYISCPSCGRTMFDLQTTIARVKAATSHLTGLKIGVMGCVVNGPGEMADADYGYVGAGRGRVSLYKGKVCVEKNIPEEEAIDKLIGLIQANGDWKERE